MIKLKITIIILLMAVLRISAAENSINGTVYEEGSDKTLAGATVYWEGSTIGSTSDEKGNFKIVKKPEFKKLIVSYVGFRTDTVKVLDESNNEIKIRLNPNNNLQEVVVVKSKATTIFSKLNPFGVQTLTGHGLQGMACCNLSESFQNSATVDVGYSDAISGSKQIKMLGLAGAYSQIMMEKIPSIRGFRTAFGLNFVPGSWMESIQVSKGTSSVVDGYEGITGQINVELKKPQRSDPVYADVYTNSEMMKEANVLATKSFNNDLSTMLLAHGSYSDYEMDDNNDGFLDMPKTKRFNIMNRWNHETEDHHFQFGFNVIQEKRQAGQLKYYDGDKTAYNTDIDVKDYSAFLKTGFKFPEFHESTLGLIFSYNYYDQKSNFGQTIYNARQNSFYTNAIYQAILWNDENKVSGGISFQYDKFDETLVRQGNNLNPIREEKTPGVFAEYTLDVPEILSVILGFRYDHNSWGGNIYTPRMHVKYNIDESTIFRGSIGLGTRSANVLIENIGILASNRTINFAENFKLEKALNCGFSISKDFEIDNTRKVTIVADFYRTNFINQVVTDLETSGQVSFYNLDGKSYSNSYQIEINAEPIKRFNLTAAFRYNDVETDFENVGLKDKPLVNKFKGVLSFSYSTKFDKWRFDFTTQYNGQSRLPNTETSPLQYQLSDKSSDYFMLYTQITKKFRHIQIYAGIENILDYKQKNPIVSSDDTNNKYFDSSMIWGPITGRLFYGGLRYIF